MSHLIDLVWASRHVSPMTDIHTFVQDHVAVWNEPGAERRRTLVHALWQEDAHHLCDDVDGHHGTVKLRWELVSAKGGGAISTGLDFLVLGDDGRIRTGYQFVET